MPLRTDTLDVAFTGCVLLRILNNQGESAVRRVLEASGPSGDRLRHHAEICDDCHELIYVLYHGTPIPRKADPLTPELLQYLKDLG